jgi:hypothetical protein
MGMTGGCFKRKLIGWKAKVSLRKYVMEDNEGKKPRDRKTWEEFKRKVRKSKLKIEIKNGFSHQSYTVKQKTRKGT